jgi:hypothetical protein
MKYNEKSDRRCNILKYNKELCEQLAILQEW